MSTWFRRRRSRNLDELEELSLRRSNGVRRVLGVVALILLVLVAFLASMLVLSPLLDLHTLSQEKEIAEQDLQRARADEAEAQNRFRWMADSEYYEQIARDRANQAKSGETVIRRPEPKEEGPKEEPRHRKN